MQIEIPDVDSSVKQVIVMRTDLNMRKGKMVTQGAHASGMYWPGTRGRSLTSAESIWENYGTTKITVKATSEEQLLDIYSQARQAGLTCHMVVDAGKTEFKGVATRTCLCIGPNYSEEIDKITGDLPLL